MFQRKQPAESTVSFDLPSSAANIDDESDYSPGGHLQKSRNSRLLTEKLFKKKVSSRLLHHDELQQNSEYLRESESSIKLILDQHHPNSKHNVKIFSTGTPIISKRSVYDSDRRKATMKHILQSTRHSFEEISSPRNNHEDNNLFYDRIGADATRATTFRKSNKMGFASNIREKVNRPSTASLFSNNEQSRIESKIGPNKANDVGKNHHINDNDYNNCLFSSKTIQEKSKMKNEKMKPKNFDISEKRKQENSFPNEEFSKQFHDSSMQHNVTEKLFNNWTGMEDRMAINRNRNLGEKNHYNRLDMRRPWTSHSMAIPHTNLSSSSKEYSVGKERSFQRSCDVTKDKEFHQLSRTLFESNKMNSTANLTMNISEGSVHDETKSDNRNKNGNGDGKSNGMIEDVQYRNGNQAAFSRLRTRKEKLIYDTGCQSTHACSSSEMKEKEKEVMERDERIEKEERIGNDEIVVNEDEGIEEKKEKALANLVKNKVTDISNRNMSDSLYGILSVPGLFDLLGPQNVYRSHASLTYTADKRFQKAVEEVDLSSGIKTDNLGKWMESAAIQKVKFYTPGPRMKFY